MSNILNRIMVAADLIRTMGGLPARVYLGRDQMAELDAITKNWTTSEDPNIPKELHVCGYPVTKVEAGSYFEVTQPGIRAVADLITDRDRWQKECEANRRLLADTEAALAQTLETIEDMARGHTDLINLLIACMAQGEALPESLRGDIAALLGTAVVIRSDAGGVAQAEPLIPGSNPFE